MYTLQFDSEVITALNKIAKVTRKRIIEKLKKTKQNPHHYFLRLQGRLDYRLRIGKYRVIADIDDNKKVISITLVGLRKNIYKTNSL